MSTQGEDSFLVTSLHYKTVTQKIESCSLAAIERGVRGAELEREVGNVSFCTSTSGITLLTLELGCWRSLKSGYKPSRALEELITPLQNDVPCTIHCWYRNSPVRKSFSRRIVSVSGHHCHVFLRVIGRL